MHLPPPLRALLERRLFRAGLWLLAAILAWGALAGLIAPPILRSVLEKELSQALGNTTTLERVGINPYTLSIGLEGIAVPLPDGSPFARAELLELRLSPESLLKLAPVLSGVRLVRPEIDLALRPDGKLSPMDFAPAPAPQAAPEDPFEIKLTELELVDGRIAFDDQLFSAKHEISELNLFVPVASTLQQDREQPIAPRLTALVDGKPLRADANLTPFAARGRNIISANLAALSVSRLTPYLQRVAPLTLAGGELSLDVGLGMEKTPNGDSTMLLNAGLRLKDIDLRTPAKGELLRLAGAEIGLNWDIFGETGLVLSEAVITNPSLTLARKEDGGLELLDWLPSQNGKKDKAAKPMPVLLKHLALTGGRVAWTDRSLPGPFTAEATDIALTLTNLNPASAKPGACEFSCSLAGGGSLNITGGIAPSPLSLDLKVAVDGLALKPLAPLLPRPLRLEDGSLKTEARMRYAAAGSSPGFRLEDGSLDLSSLALGLEQAKGVLVSLGALRATGVTATPDEQSAGEISLTDLSLTDQGRPAARLASLALTDCRVGPGREGYAAKSLVLNQPVLGARRDAEGRISLLQLIDKLIGPAEKKEEGKKPEAAPQATAGEQPRVRLDLLEVKRGRVFLSDALGVKARVDNLAVQARNLDTAATTPSPVRLEALVNGSPLTGEGTLLLTPQGADVEARAGLDALDLAPFSPLAQHYLGYAIARGRLSLDSTLRLKDRNIALDQRIRLLNFDLGEQTPSPDAIDAPVKLGLALLKDSKNDIDIQLPINGNLDNPEFGTGSIVRKAVGNLLLSVVTSPFAIIGGLLGGSSGSNLEYVAFTPGDDRLSQSNREALKQVADLMKSRRSLTLGLVPQADENDRESLGEAYVRRRMREERFNDLSRKEQAATSVDEMRWKPGSEEAADLLFKVYKEEPIDKPRNLIGMVKELSYQEMYKAVADSRPTDDAALHTLGQARAQAVRDALVAIDPALAPRITIRPTAVPGAGPRVLLGSGD